MAHLQKLIPVSPGVISPAQAVGKPIFDGIGILHVHMYSYERQGLSPCVYCREPAPAPADVEINPFEALTNSLPARPATMENICPVGTMRLQANDLWIGDNFIRRHIVKLVPEELDGT